MHVNSVPDANKIIRELIESGFVETTTDECWKPWSNKEEAPMMEKLDEVKNPQRDGCFPDLAVDVLMTRYTPRTIISKGQDDYED